MTTPEEQRVARIKLELVLELSRRRLRREPDLPAAVREAYKRAMDHAALAIGLQDAAERARARHTFKEGKCNERH
jgi:hypothetical protein